MKKTLIRTLLFVAITANAQEFQGKAEYFSKLIISNEIDLQLDEDENFKKSYEEAIKKATEKMFTLTFNQKEALYEEQQNLEKPSSANGEPVFMISFSGQGKKYMNIKEKTKISEDEIFGKEFLIVEKLESFDWKLTDESKKIGDYTCLKAVLTIPITEKQKLEYEEFLKSEEKKPALFKMNKPEDKKVIAWYTPEIPVSFGPSNYWGLPGLILEISDGENILLCSKVTLSNKEKTKIKVPNVGKKVNRQEFEAIEKKKMDSMKNDDNVIIFETQK
jgi:GLPGLI family protein